HPRDHLIICYQSALSGASASLSDHRRSLLSFPTRRSSDLPLGDVYRIDGLGSREGGSAVRVRTLRAPREFDSTTTGADAHPSGTRLLLRTYTRAWELRSPDARSFEDVLDAEPVAVPEASQPQGEAISYTANGRGYLLGGEGIGSPLYPVSCSEPWP